MVNGSSSPHDRMTDRGPMATLCSAQEKKEKKNKA